MNREKKKHTQTKQANKHKETEKLTKQEHRTSLAQEGTPFTELYEHMIDLTFACVTHALRDKVSQCVCGTIEVSIIRFFRTIPQCRYNAVPRKLVDKSPQGLCHQRPR